MTPDFSDSVSAQPMMTRREAEEAIASIRSDMESMGARIFDLYEREGWKALGYDSWRACVQAEFGWGTSYAYRKLQAARINLELSPMGETVPANERQARELARLPDADIRADVWTRAVEAHGEQVTAAHVREIAREAMGESDPQLLAVIDLETGEIVPERDRESPLGDVPQMREMSDEERAFDRLASLSLITRIDPVATAEAALQYRSGSAQAIAARSGAILGWYEAFFRALHERIAEPMRRVK